MKKILGCLCVLIVSVIVGCSNDETQSKKEVITVPVPSRIIVKEPPAKSTTITVDKNGVKVGTKKLDVTVKKQ